jgi:hypothetical protein
VSDVEIEIPKGFSLTCACGKRHTFGEQLADGEALHVAVPDDAPSPIRLDMGGEWTLLLHYFRDGRVPPVTMEATCPEAKEMAAKPEAEKSADAPCEHPPVATLKSVWCRKCGAFKVDGRVFENQPGTTDSLKAFLGIVTDDGKAGLR